MDSWMDSKAAEWIGGSGMDKGAVEKTGVHWDGLGGNGVDWGSAG